VPPGIFQMKRINVIGTSGSGKSTFARALAAKLGHPYIEMDHLHWKPNWVESPIEEFREKVKSACESECWILDGNYEKVADVKYERVTLIIWLDFSYARTFWQVVKRSVSRALVRQELWPNTNNRESFIKMFQRDSIVLWMMQTYKKNRARYSARMKDPAFAHVKFVHLRSPQETKDFLDSLK
jgi:adenylate kinase family enzyme